MDLQSQFKDLNIDENLDKDVKEIQKKLDTTNDESKKFVKDLEARLSKIKSSAVAGTKEVADLSQVVENANHEEGEDDEADLGDEELIDEQEQTFYEKVSPFILPIAITFFAIIFAGMFLYFFSKSRVEQTAQAIVNQGVPEQVYYPPAPVPVIIKEEPLTCTEPLILNETLDACILPEPEPEPVASKPVFENGQTVEMNVKFSYDKYNYDNKPRGIYVLKDQDFEGEYENFKVTPTNRAYANDYFFGIDRYAVNLMGACVYVVDNARVEVENAQLKDNYFTGKVTKVIEASKPRVDCGGASLRYNTTNDYDARD